MTLRRRFPGLKFGTEAVDCREFNTIFKERPKMRKSLPKTTLIH
ncbi:protein of unknown function [[Clostridium] ultunense Esp]|uniref:Uncharacterized protein n=1 Tax=[Clostridium] ultunense Esp TaxID=1288971 RepID=A0A1M4PRA6_9FIRM|nr:protein of unknown function [[Clostridium] ultunense Esp]